MAAAAEAETRPESDSESEEEERISIPDPYALSEEELKLCSEVVACITRRDADRICEILRLLIVSSSVNEYETAMLPEDIQRFGRVMNVLKNGCEGKSGRRGFMLDCIARVAMEDTDEESGTAPEMLMTYATGLARSGWLVGLPDMFGTPSLASLTLDMLFSGSDYEVIRKMGETLFALASGTFHQFRERAVRELIHAPWWHMEEKQDVPVSASAIKDLIPEWADFGEGREFRKRIAARISPLFGSCAPFSLLRVLDENEPFFMEALINTVDKGMRLAGEDVKSLFHDNPTKRRVYEGYMAKLVEICPPALLDKLQTYTAKAALLHKSYLKFFMPFLRQMTELLHDTGACFGFGSVEVAETVVLCTHLYEHYDTKEEQDARNAARIIIMRSLGVGYSQTGTVLEQLDSALDRREGEWSAQERIETSEMLADDVNSYFDGSYQWAKSVLVSPRRFKTDFPNLFKTPSGKTSHTRRSKRERPEDAQAADAAMTQLITGTAQLAKRCLACA